MEVEARRLENLRYKAKLLSDLNLDAHPITQTKRDPNTKQVLKKRRLSFESKPTRVSSRLAASSSRPSYTEPADQKFKLVERRVSKKSQKSTDKDEIEADESSIVPATNAEDIRAGWTKWKSTAPQPERDENGTIHFNDFPLFTPNKTPEEMIREGCFGGSYFRKLRSRKLGIFIEDDWKELPAPWYLGLNVKKHVASQRYDADVNKFKVACGQTIEEWEAQGWIAYEHDIRGWFQWYCRFYMGRRCVDDDRQVSRWKKCVGETGRWRRMLLNKYVQMGVRDVFDDGEEEDKEVSPVMHQTCHHWAYQVRRADLDAAWRGNTR